MYDIFIVSPVSHPFHASTRFRTNRILAVILLFEKKHMDPTYCRHGQRCDDFQRRRPADTVINEKGRAAAAAVVAASSLTDRDVRDLGQHFPPRDN